MDAVHSAKKRFVCPVCDKKFPYENSLKMHMMLHTNDRLATVTSLKEYYIFLKIVRNVKSIPCKIFYVVDLLCAIYVAVDLFLTTL